VPRFDTARRRCALSADFAVKRQKNLNARRPVKVTAINPAKPIIFQSFISESLRSGIKTRATKC
jgi:hypothetical protein